jgi:type 1 glutamine amidotransferase
VKLRPAAEAIAEALEVSNSASGGKGEAVLVTSRHGQGRIVCSTLGHDLSAMQEQEFIAGFAQGVEWAATGAVTRPGASVNPGTTAGKVRALVITGGHDHETSFYSLFEGYKDLSRVPVSSSAMAFQKDVRGKYDVIVMYDFSRDLDATGRKNLREFIEHGGGVVVLHHALLNYQDWPWWSEEAVGGSYRLKTEGNRPSSTVKDGQSMFVTPETEHPITRGIGPFHVVDEAYKRMCFSTRVTPLLSTDQSTSDRLLAWIGPSAAFRVVAIQLGHGPAIFQHPAYRSLVHNAMLWAAGTIQ